MKYTSAEAAKLLRKLNEEKDNILIQEGNTREFLAAMGENIESVRPEYDYAATQKNLEKLDGRILAVKHMINQFNVSTEVPGTGMTIDQVLIRIPQLTAQKKKLSVMQSKLPKQRENAGMFGRSNTVIDYCYANYDIAAAKADYERVSEELATIQTALDLVNSTATMEIEL